MTAHPKPPKRTKKKAKALKRKGAMTRTQFSGTTSNGAFFIGHGNKKMDAKGRAALQAVMEAASKHPALLAGPAKKKRARLKPRSEKMAAKYAGGGDCEKCGGGEVLVDGLWDNCAACNGTGLAEGRRALVARLLKGRPICEAGERIGDHLAWHRSRANGLFWERCQRRSVDVHEILARSAGGSILDEDNCLCVCRRCHKWIGDNPREALKLGLRRSRYEGRNPP